MDASVGSVLSIRAANGSVRSHSCRVVEQLRLAHSDADQRLQRWRDVIARNTGLQRTSRVMQRAIGHVEVAVDRRQRRVAAGATRSQAQDLLCRVDQRPEPWNLALDVVVGDDRLRVREFAGRRREVAKSRRAVIAAHRGGDRQAIVRECRLRANRGGPVRSKVGRHLAIARHAGQQRIRPARFAASSGFRAYSASLISSVIETIESEYAPTFDANGFDVAAGQEVRA